MYCSESQDPFPHICKDHLGHTTVTCISSFLWQFANTIQKTAVVQRKFCKLKAERVIVTGHITIRRLRPSSKPNQLAASPRERTPAEQCLQRLSWNPNGKVQAGALSAEQTPFKAIVEYLNNSEYPWLESGDVSKSTLPAYFFSTKELLWDRSFMIST